MLLFSWFFFFLFVPPGAVHSISIVMHYHKLVTSVSLRLNHLACESDASQFQKHKLIGPLDLCVQLLNMPQLRVRHVVTQLALLEWGNYSVQWVSF